jgi:hypothetical protein
VINSQRDVYHACHTTEDVKKALSEEAGKLKISMSKLTHDMLRDALKARGYDVVGYEYKVT